MSVLAAIIAIIIFANPYISAVDILPDALGCLLIWFALRRAEFFSPKLEEARRMWIRLMLVTAADAAASYLIPASDRTMVLLTVFVFRIIEAVMLYTATVKTFDGLVFLGTKFDAVGIYMHDSRKTADKKLKKEASSEERLDRILEHERQRYEHDTAESVDEEHRHRATERYRHAVAKISAESSRTKRERDGISSLSSLTLMFVIVRTLACVLPEFTALSTYDYSHLGDVAPGFDIYRFRRLFIVLGFFVCAVVAVIWGIKMIRYISGINRDKLFCQALRDEYENFSATHSGIHDYRRIKAALISLAIGIVLTMDILISNKNYVPDFAAAIMFFLFFLFLFRTGKNAVFGLVASGVYVIASAVQWSLVNSYISEFIDFTRAQKSDDAMAAYIGCCVAAVIAEIAFVVIMVLVFRQLKRVIETHTGYVSEDGVPDNKTLYIREMLKKENVRSFVFSCIVSAMSVVYMISVGINKRVVIKDESVDVVYVTYVPYFEGVVTVNAVISLIFIVMTVKYISDVYDSVKERYKFV